MYYLSRTLLEIAGIRGPLSPTFRTLFLMFGKITGGPSPRTAEMIQAAAQMGKRRDDCNYLSDFVKELAQDFFTEGVETKTPFKEIVADFARQIEDAKIRRKVLYLLVRVAPNNAPCLYEAAESFGLPSCELRKSMFPTIFNMLGRMIQSGDSSHSLAENQINVVEEVMDVEELDNEQRQLATEYFYGGAQDYWGSGDLRLLADEYAEYEEDIDKRRQTLSFLVQTATACGHLHTRLERDLEQARASFGLPPDELEEEIALGMKFLMFGCMAKADGHVSESEINVVETFMDLDGELDNEQRRRCVKIFNRGKNLTSHRIAAAIFAKYAGDTERWKVLLYHLVLIARADGEVHEQEDRCLRDVADVFELSGALRTITEQIKKEEEYVQKCYESLGCAPSVSDAELTKCYRDLSRQYHPDVISSKNLAPGFHKFSQEKFQELQEEYETITKHRKYGFLPPATPPAGGEAPADPSITKHRKYGFLPPE